MAGKGVVSMDVTIIEGKDGLKKLTIDAGALRKIMESNIRVAQRFEKKVVGFASLTIGINAVNNAFSQLASTTRLLTGESEGFDKAMKEANTMAGKDSAGFGRLKDEVADLAKEIPIARDLLANGLYQTISNGVPEDNWIEFLNTSARSAVGGLADINKVVGVTSTLIKNYGLEWSDAADIQDKIQLTAKNGVTSFEQLAQALPRVTGNAATLGVSIDELMGTFATLTGVSGNTAEVSTQLAAIFTSLVKPSSEAAKMAAEMGIQFDAAAIQAAGGFQNFLAQLDSSVKAYAESAGVLEQEVYGRLFGSAEAIRALIPLQGELADKFADNIANMENSAGTMDAAYADMSSTGEAVTRMLRNQWAAVIDVVAGFTSAAQPYINFTAGLLSTGSSAAILVTTFKQLNAQQMIFVAGAKLGRVAVVALGLRGKSAAAAMRVLKSAMEVGAYRATALKIALRGLLLATGALGAAVFAAVAVIGHFSSKADKAAESAKKLSRCTDAYVSGAAEAKTGITGEINTLKELIKTNGDTADAVRHLNETYGDIFGTYRTAAEWMDTLIAKSKDYIRYKGYEAQALAISQKIAEAEQRQVAAQDIKDDLQKTGVDSRGRRKQKTPAGEVWRKVDGWDENEKTLNEAREDVSRLTAEYDRLIAKTEDWRTKLSARKTPPKSDPKSDPQAGSGTEVKVPEGSIAELEKQLSDIRSRIRLEVDADSRAALYRELCSIEDQKRHIEFSYKYPDFKPSELPEVDQVQLNVETDIAKYQPELEDTSDWVESIGDKSKDMAATAGNAFNQLGGAISGLGNALEIPELNVAGTMAQAIATMVSGFAAATAQGAALGPFGWMAVAASGLAQLTAMVSAVKGLPAFANGGIVSGPTVGLIGEYAGASNNPEVVAPLDKLNSMLKPSGTPVIVGGTLRVSGRDLICVLANETRVASKSGRRTNIKV